MTASTDSTQHSFPAHRRRLWVLVAAVVIAAVVIIGAVWGTHRSNAPSSPMVTAQEWARAVVDKRSDDAASLECSRSTEDVIHTLQLTVTSVSGVDVGKARHAGSRRWQVPMRLMPSSTAFTVTVVRRDGRYVVCG